MKNPLISVIVPIYMIERYVGICIESIIKQTYKNLEIILVDDGSKDRCPNICDLYAGKDNRIKVIHKPNGGIVSARKAGLQQSNGAYISYVDGDDWIESEFIESLYTAALENDADIVCAGYTRDLYSQSVYFTNGLSSGVYKGEKLRNLWKTMISNGSYYRSGITTYVWNKLFKRETLIDPQNKVDSRISIGEDGAVTYPALLACRCAAVIDNTAYHYRQREDSMLKQSTNYVDEAQKIKYLYDYLISWSRSADPNLNIKNQIVDYVLSIAIIRFGGRLPSDGYSAFNKSYYGNNVIICSAGTFGQQLYNRFKELGHCNVAAWLDDDYWEYRRCCLDVDPVENVTRLEFDYILIAAIDYAAAEQFRNRLLHMGISAEKILTVSVPKDKEQLVNRFIDVNAVRSDEIKRKREVLLNA